MTLLTRDDLIGSLRELIIELRAEGEPVGLRVVGGAAIALRHFDRHTTADVDALHVRPGTDDAVTEAANRVADRRGWDHGWLNFKVTNTGSEPLYGRPTAWETVYDDGAIVIQIAGADTLLAMKLRANRPGRDTDDIRKLLAICEITTVEEADGFYAECYPGESLPGRAWTMVSSILHTPSTKPEPVDPLDLS